MNVFFGAAIQGVKNRGERAKTYSELMGFIKSAGFAIVTEHTSATTLPETLMAMESAIGKLPEKDQERWIFVRDKMIEGVEGDIQAAVFEVSVPSLGTGIEIAHAYLRPRMGLSSIPILALYEKDYWPNQLTTMIRGITPEAVPDFQWKEYASMEEAKSLINDFLKGCRPQS